MLPPPGTPVPPFTTTAAVSGREVSPQAFKGRRAVLVLHGSKSTEVAKEVSKALRAKYKPDEVFSASLVDLRSFGGLWKKVAEAQVKANYEKMAGKVKENQPGEDPADWVVICPDWDGSVGKALGVEDPDSNPTVIVVDADGKVKASLQGADAAPKTMALLG
jgi:Redoxin